MFELSLLCMGATEVKDKLRSLHSELDAGLRTAPGCRWTQCRWPLAAPAGSFRLPHGATALCVVGPTRDGRFGRSAHCT